MAIKVAINGYGRIGRNVLRALYEANRTQEINIVAINDLGDANTNAHLTQYDTAQGKFPGKVGVEGGDLIVNGDHIKVCAERDPAKLPWGELGVDVVLEATGRFRERDQAAAHLAAGAKKVLVSAPGKNMDGTYVCGVNEDTIPADAKIISNASCTTNCLAPLAKVLDESVGIVHGIMTTIHSFTNDQVLTDVYHKDLHRARSAVYNQIPTKTGAATAVALVLPKLAGKLDGLSIRVPTIDVSLVDFTFVPKKDTTVEELNALFQDAATKLPGILAYNDKPLVSSDFMHDAHSCTFDATQTRVLEGNLVKVLAWYDNEWGFSNRMLDMTVALANA